MTRVGRLAGAILVETAGAFYLVGNLKEPCNFAAAGFEPPCETIDGVAHPSIRLQRCGPVHKEGPCLTCDAEGEAVARCLAQRLLITRNGSVSERLWGLLGDLDAPATDINWLISMPQAVWDIVRDTVLRCT